MKQRKASTRQSEWASYTVSLTRKEVREDADKFTAKVKKLGLTDPSEYAKSKVLVRWIKQFKNVCFVPEELLRELHLKVDLSKVPHPEWADVDAPPVEMQHVTSFPEGFKV